ncbi:ABC transporter substrate-binding protein [Izhakiella capsodis]|nr:ABC transporter substrate-binding protein [Izhakiella capsodis]
MLLNVAEAAPNFPLTIENCGYQETFNDPPQRVITIGQHETELLLALGLEKTIKGTSVWFGKLPADLTPRGKGLEKLADNTPGFEAVVARTPDLVLAQYSWHLGPQGEVATREQFEKLGIKTWLSPADCINKSVTDSANADGARTAPFSIDTIKQEINELARIFNIEARGEALNETLSKRIASAIKRVKQPPATPLKVVFWFSSSRLNGDPWVAGSNGVPGWISRTLGLQNIISIRDEWPAVSWEHIVRLQPDLIVFADMDRRLYPADDAKIKRHFLLNDPLTRQMPAVQKDHIIIVPAMSLNPSLRNVEAVELLSRHIATLTGHS